MLRRVRRRIQTLSEWLLVLVLRGYVLGLLLIRLWHHALGTWLSVAVVVVVVDVG